MVEIGRLILRGLAGKNTSRLVNRVKQFGSQCIRLIAIVNTIHLGVDQLVVYIHGVGASSTSNARDARQSRASETSIARAARFCQEISRDRSRRRLWSSLRSSCASSWE